jgi:hypothetical protein
VKRPHAHHSPSHILNLNSEVKPDRGMSWLVEGDLFAIGATKSQRSGSSTIDGRLQKFTGSLERLEDMRVRVEEKEKLSMAMAREDFSNQAVDSAIR